GKLLHVIKGVYHATRLVVKINNKLSNAVDYKRGVHQECPASPMLKISYELQKLFDILTEWCKRWNINVNNKKCGIMAIKCLADVTFKIKNRFIPSVIVSTLQHSQNKRHATKFKVMVIEAIIKAVATYTKCGKSAAMTRIRQELSLTGLNIKTSVARTLEFKKKFA
ncbi:hypothetical protein BB561_003827, partial [Smittium simulii]